jgi:hypothetical protein
MNENSLVYEALGEVIIYLNINLQRNICQILLAHFKNMLGQATLWDYSDIGLTLLFQITYMK